MTTFKAGQMVVRRPEYYDRNWESCCRENFCMAVNSPIKIRRVTSEGLYFQGTYGSWFASKFLLAFENTPLEDYA